MGGIGQLTISPELFLAGPKRGPRKILGKFMKGGEDVKLGVATAKTESHFEIRNELLVENNLLTIDDFPNICRVCMSTENLQNFFELSFENNVTLVELLSKITDIQFDDDTNLPNKLCSDCINKVSELYLFIKQFKESNAILATIEQPGDILVCSAEDTDYKNTTEVIIITTKDEVQEDVKKPKKVVIEEDFVKCNPCEKIFLNKLQLRKHIMKNACHKSYAYFCKICPKRYKNFASLAKHSKTHDRLYKCDICKKQFKLSQNLVRHEKMHKEDRPFKCNICKKTFTRIITRDEHVRAHTGETPYECKFCTKSFHRRASHQLHEFRHRIANGEITSEEKATYACTKCSKVFSTKWILKTHFLTHTGERNFKCELCKKSFFTKGSLESHSRSHTGLKPFNCTKCEKSFSQRSNLKAHMAMHNGEKAHKCMLCGKSFTQSCHLKVHQRVHTGEKAFICNYCGKRFALNCNLKAHISIHTGDRPYVCITCGVSFHDSNSLKRHTESHVKEPELF